MKPDKFNSQCLNSSHVRTMISSSLQSHVTANEILVDLKFNEYSCLFHLPQLHYVQKISCHIITLKPINLQH